MSRAPARRASPASTPGCARRGVPTTPHDRSGELHQSTGGAGATVLPELLDHRRGSAAGILNLIAPRSRAGCRRGRAQSIAPARHRQRPRVDVEGELSARVGGNHRAHGGPRQPDAVVADEPITHRVFAAPPSRRTPVDSGPAGIVGRVADQPVDLVGRCRDHDRLDDLSRVDARHCSPSAFGPPRGASPCCPPGPPRNGRDGRLDRAGDHQRLVEHHHVRARRGVELHVRPEERQLRNLLVHPGLLGSLPEPGIPAVPRRSARGSAEGRRSRQAISSAQ